MNYGTRTKRAHDKTKIKVNQYDLKGNFIKTWDSIKEANDFYHTTHIAECCNIKSKRNIAKGFLWKYTKE